jgi:hypothetical protein
MRLFIPLVAVNQFRVSVLSVRIGFIVKIRSISKGKRSVRDIKQVN